MKPSQVANTLRRIASKIDNSVSPQRALVARDLRRVIMAASVDPVSYIIRVSDKRYLITPFNENVIEEINEFPPVSVSLNDCVKYMKINDVSLMMDHYGDDVEWVKAGDPKARQLLRKMEESWMVEWDEEEAAELGF